MPYLVGCIRFIPCYSSLCYKDALLQGYPVIHQGYPVTLSRIQGYPVIHTLLVSLYPCAQSIQGYKDTLLFIPYYTLSRIQGYPVIHTLLQGYPVIHPCATRMNKGLQLKNLATDGYREDWRNA